MVEIVADTYALIAHYDGARSYRPFFEAEIGTTALNAVEFAHALILRGHAKRLGDLMSPVLSIIVEPDRGVVEAAARFKHERRAAGAKCSYVDAWGYATARLLDAAFLTGDEDFRGVPGVKFVKA
ncbi:MAG: PIN domain-containing protein [Thermoplasmatota archaeon]